jgi:HTH-type transcriptional regulator / antitoxin HigA
MQKQITNEEQYDEAVARIYELMQMDILPGTDESNELDTLADMVKAYDREHYPLRS